MFQRYRLFLCLFCGFFLFACNQESRVDAVAVVDMARLMRDSAPGKAAVAFLEGRQAEFQKKMDEVQKKLEKDSENKELQGELRALYMDGQQQMQAEQQNALGLLYDCAQRVMNEYRRQKGYTLLVGADAAVSFEAKADVTNDILALLNEEKIEFKPLPALAAPGRSLPGNGADAQDERAAQAGDKAEGQAGKAQEKPAGSSAAGQSKEKNEKK